MSTEKLRLFEPCRAFIQINVPLSFQCSVQVMDQMLALLYERTTKLAKQEFIMHATEPIFKSVAEFAHKRGLKSTIEKYENKTEAIAQPRNVIFLEACTPRRFTVRIIMEKFILEEPFVQGNLLAATFARLLSTALTDIWNSYTGRNMEPFGPVPFVGSDQINKKDYEHFMLVATMLESLNRGELVDTSVYNDVTAIPSLMINSNLQVKGDWLHYRCCEILYKFKEGISYKRTDTRFIQTTSFCPRLHFFGMIRSWESRNQPDLYIGVAEGVLNHYIKPSYNTQLALTRSCQLNMSTVTKEQLRGYFYQLQFSLQPFMLNGNAVVALNRYPEQYMTRFSVPHEDFDNLNFKRCPNNRTKFISTDEPIKCLQPPQYGNFASNFIHYPNAEAVIEQVDGYSDVDILVDNIFA